MKPDSVELRTPEDDHSAEASDEELMQRFCAGESTAFETLFQRHAPTVRGFAARLVGSAAAADDVTQITFLSVVRSRDRFVRGERFRPWLFAIASNAAVDALRRTRHETVTSPEDFPEEATSGASADPLLARKVRGALAQLPDSLRLPVVMHRFEGLSFEEIGQALEITESAAKVRAHRGYERLRTLLGSVWEEGK